MSGFYSFFFVTIIRVFNSTMDIMQFLLNESTTLGIINERSVAGWSPLDVAYNNFNDNAKEDIIKLLKQHGGKAYKHVSR